MTLEFLASGRSDATSDVCFIQTKSNYLPSFTLLSVVISHSFVCLHRCWSTTSVSNGDPHLHPEGGSRILLIKFGVHLRKYAVQNLISLLSLQWPTPQRPKKNIFSPSLFALQNYHPIFARTLEEKVWSLKWSMELLCRKWKWSFLVLEPSAPSWPMLVSSQKSDAQNDCCADYVHAAPPEGTAKPSTLRRFTCYVQTQCDPCASFSFQRLSPV